MNKGFSSKIHYCKDIPVTAKADVLVIGGGPAGIAAAVASARNGAKTVLVERNGFAGGMATAGLVAPMMKCYTIDGKRQIIKGIFDELVRRMELLGGAIHPGKVITGSRHTGFLSFGQDHITPFDPETLKLVSDRLFVESGVEVIYHTVFLDAIYANGVIREIIVANKSGIQALRGKVIIDCTGDADVAACAGIPFIKGRKGDGIMQPATLMCRVGNVDSGKTEEYVKNNPDDFMFLKPARKAKEAGDFPIARRRAIIQETTCPGRWNVNATRIHNLDNTDGKALSVAEIEGRRQVEIVVKYLRKYVAGFENAVLVDSGHELGIRESRHIEGKYVLSIDDIMEGTEFDDSIALCGFNVDIHDPGGTQDQFIQPNHNGAYQIPYRCLFSDKLDNLLVAGRPISASHEAAAAIRIMPSCFAMGEAAGTAAAIAAKKRISTGLVNVKELQKILSENGAIIKN